ncbi:hypothetical protein OHB24_14715 [Kribbella sp. NBC_00482]|uniref:hypothetical protein n=1 Tax=Kribbella sp. NBC_00482 TaxID=2975968 RepID=UPI002E181BB7
MTDPDPDPPATANAEPPSRRSDNAVVKAAAITALGTVAAAAFTFLGVWIGGNRADNGAVSTVTTTVTATPSPTPSLRVDRTIVDPTQDDVENLCTVVKVRVKQLPADKALAVAFQEDGDPRIHFTREFRKFPDDIQAALIYAGDELHPEDSKDSKWSIYAVVMDKELADHLSTTVEGDPGNWSAETWAPGTDIGPATHIGRNTKLGNCKF